MLVAVELGAQRRLRVVAVPDAHGVEADRCADELHVVVVALLRDEVVARDVDVAGVEADIDRGAGAEAGDEFRNLLEGRAERELRAGRVFDEDLQPGVLPRQAVDSALDGLGCQTQPFVAGKAFPASRMHDQKLRAERERLLDFRAEGVRGAGADALGLRAEVDEEAGVDHQRMDVELFTEGVELLYVDSLHRTGLPGAGAGAEYLQGVSADFDGAVDGGPDTAAGAHMGADALFGHSHLLSV